jgi:gluconolactonase
LAALALLGCGSSETPSGAAGGSAGFVVAMSGGANNSAGGGGALGGSPGGGFPGSGGLITPGVGGTPITGSGGAGATTAAGGTMGAGGGGGAAGQSTGGGGAAGSDGGAPGAGGTMPVTYPTLDASTQFGTPAQIPSTQAFTLAEGPVWDPCGKRVLFTDVNASTIYELKSDGSIGAFATGTSNANGIAFDIDGSLILAQMGGNPGHIARRDKTTGVITAIEPPGGPRLHTPDDVIVRSDGTIYFSDGDFPPIGTFNLGQLPVYALKPGASMLTNGGTVAGPNGVELSPDETTLYVDAYFEGSVYKFAVAADGGLTKGTTIATGLSSPDSLCLDAAGNLYVGVTQGIQVIRSDGTKLKLIPVTGVQATTNCTFGGDDGKTLYITAWTKIFKVDAMPIPGLDWVVNRKRLGCM